MFNIEVIFVFYLKAQSSRIDFLEAEIERLS